MVWWVSLETSVRGCWTRSNNALGSVGCGPSSKVICTFSLSSPNMLGRVCRMYVGRRVVAGDLFA